MRALRNLMVVVLAGVVLAGGAALGIAAAGCSVTSGAGDGDAPDQARALEPMRMKLSRVADALRAGDKAAFDEWLPVGGGSVAADAAVRESFDAVYYTLEPLPWRTFRFDVQPLRGVPGVYLLRGVGQLGAAGPADRIAVERYLVLHTGDDGDVIVADKTTESLRRRYLMALHDPVVLQRPGLIVLGERRATDRAVTVMDAAARARPRLARIGVATRPTVLLTVFGSLEDAHDALGIDAAGACLTFFAYAALRVSDRDTPVQDVGVMGPWLRDTGESMDAILMHELAHAYTVRWFAASEHPPALLIEGIAQAAEGRPAVYLRDEVATGDQLWPLPESFATEDLWADNDSEAVSLGYEIGGSLVDYVLARWGAQRLRPFVQAVAGAEATEAGMDRALGDALGVSWRQFYAGWRRYVLTGA